METTTVRELIENLRAAHFEYGAAMQAEGIVSTSAFRTTAGEVRAAAEHRTFAAALAYERAELALRQAVNA